MNRLATKALGLASVTILAQLPAAMAGSNYEAGPTVSDNGVIAGVILLALIGVALLANGGIKPPPADEDEDSDEE